jgi:uncharacterized protein YlxW (UPF0749 family)
MSLPSSIVAEVAATMESAAADLASTLQERDKLAAEKALLVTERDKLAADKAQLEAERDKLASDLNQAQEQSKKASILPAIDLSVVADHVERAGLITAQEKQATVEHIRKNPVNALAVLVADMAPLLRTKEARSIGRPVSKANQGGQTAAREAWCPANVQ